MVVVMVVVGAEEVADSGVGDVEEAGDVVVVVVGSVGSEEVVEVVDQIDIGN